MVFAIALKLLLQPALRVLERLHVPRILAALLFILALFGTIVGVGTAFRVPPVPGRPSFRRAFLGFRSGEFHAGTHQYPATVFAAGGKHRRNGTITKCGHLERGASFLLNLFTGTRNFASGLFTTVLFLFFLLVSGDIFLRRLVEILPRFSSKRQAVDISQQIESDISAYLVTITIMNAAVGIATALAMWLTGVGDPILWGTVAFLLNYAPILGTALGMLIFLLAGLLTMNALASAASCGTLLWISFD